MFIGATCEIIMSSQTIAQPGQRIRVFVFNLANPTTLGRPGEEYSTVGIGFAAYIPGCALQYSFQLRNLVIRAFNCDSKTPEIPDRVEVAPKGGKTWEPDTSDGKPDYYQPNVTSKSTGKNVGIVDIPGLTDVEKTNVDPKRASAFAGRNSSSA
jgi:hypothetical protein